MNTEAKLLGRKEPLAASTKPAVVLNGVLGIAVILLGVAMIALGGRDWTAVAVLLLCLAMGGWLLFQAVKNGRNAWKLDEEGQIIQGSITDRWTTRSQSRSGTRITHWLRIEYRVNMTDYAIRQRTPAKMITQQEDAVSVRYLPDDPQVARLQMP